MFPAYMSPEAKACLTGLLEREPADRLGTKGAEEIKSQAFFADIDWVALYEKRIVPPFKPTTTQVRVWENAIKLHRR